MVFSDSTNKTGLVEDIDFLVNTDSTSYPIAQKTRNINRWYHRAVSWILEAQDEWDFDDILNANYPIATTSLVADQQDYPLPATAGIAQDRVLLIQRVEVSYDGSNWYKAEPFDLGEGSVALGTSADINEHFDKTEPFYDVRYNAIWLYPIPDSAVTNGLKIWFLRRITDIFTTSDTTQEPSFDEQFHRILSYGGAYDYAVARGMPEANYLREEIRELKQELQRFYGGKQKDRIYQLKVAKKNYK